MPATARAGASRSRGRRRSSSAASGPPCFQDRRNATERGWLTCTACALALQVAAAGGGAFGNELSERAALRQNVGALFAGAQFAELERIGTRYRESRSRTASGLWHLTLYHAGIDAALGIDRVDEALWRKAERITRGWVEKLYARIYWYASPTQYGDALFTESRVDWDRMKRAFDAVPKRYPDGWNLNNFARFACPAQDRPKAAIAEAPSSRERHLVQVTHRSE